MLHVIQNLFRLEKPILSTAIHLTKSIATQQTCTSHLKIARLWFSLYFKLVLLSWLFLQKRINWFQRRHFRFRITTTVLIHMLFQHMFLQQKISCELGTAKLALERFLSSVCQNVSLQIRWPTEAPRTIRTAIFTFNWFRFGLIICFNSFIHCHFTKLHGTVQIIWIFLTQHLFYARWHILFAENFNGLQIGELRLFGISVLFGSFDVLGKMPEQFRRIFISYMTIWTC